MTGETIRRSTKPATDPSTQHISRSGSGIETRLVKHYKTYHNLGTADDAFVSITHIVADWAVASRLQTLNTLDSLQDGQSRGRGTAGRTNRRFALSLAFISCFVTV
jgi:hypothetical protein